MTDTPITQCRDQILIPFGIIAGEASGRSLVTASSAANPDPSKTQLTFSATRHQSSIDFVFELQVSEKASLVIPDLRPVQEHRRSDELWTSTCFEVFIAPKTESTYLELNLSPSGRWNVYVFDSYRQRMRPAQDAVSPHPTVERGESGRFVIKGSLKWQGYGECAALLSSGPLVLSAAAVLEYDESSGRTRKEYWATAHAGQKPDFHLRESFILTL